jgi:SAM-dependent methyltransferase
MALIFIQVASILALILQPLKGAECNPRSGSCAEDGNEVSLVQLMGVVKHGSERIAEKSELESPRGTQLMHSRICNAMKDRSFHYNDDVCGKQSNTIDDMMTAFGVEQAYWSEQGTYNPWWAVVTHDEFNGMDIPTEKQLKFYTTGVETLEQMLPQLQALGYMSSDKMAKSDALDFGCGLGRMSNALISAGFKKVKCVDQAKSMLDTAKDSLTKLAGQGVVAKDAANRIEFVQSGPDLLCKVAPGSVDFVHSIITLQHMKPQLQTAYIEQLCEALRPTGVGYFQIPTYIDWNNHEVHCSMKQEQSMMMMHYTPRAEVERHLKSSGCNVLSVQNSSAITVGGESESLVFFFQK